jgi:hypothetical protein
MYEPDAEGGEGRVWRSMVGVLVRIAMSMRVHVPVGRSVVVAVGVSVVEAALPPEEEPGGKKHYYAPDRHLGYPLDDLRQIAAQKHERQAREDEGCAVAEAQRRPIRLAFLARLSLRSEAIRVVSAARWSGSVACLKPIRKLISNTISRLALGPCRMPSSQPSIAATQAPFYRHVRLLGTQPMTWQRPASSGRAGRNGPEAVRMGRRVSDLCYLDYDGVRRRSSQEHHSSTP